MTDDGEVISRVTPLTRDGSVVAVADGVGGRPDGRWAAFAAIESLATKPIADNEAKALRLAIASAHRSVLARTSRGIGPATTIAGISASEEGVLIFNVGDSRVYQIEHAAVRLLTVDHRSQTDSRAITRFLGGSEANAIPYIDRLEVDLGTEFLISTDGFHQFLRETDLLLLKDLTPDRALASLFDMALDNGSNDNLSAIFCRIE
ncbi:PP2C family protein-serine/threonine phosphatase [Mesorhizobium kowhaii]|uniref:PPM-type phosphatase domain-containing protein n=1 Tax=Mesorhizobium kowhaii TaxID=1300272 RepID=A0A2W7C0H2_9HYPH|nr:protein phosphatase 2C domain-containing protein [Mesorhizobium kowhaii]PZV36407.1 hypothetical protein B5V02_21740 [Mesorhizobium kowhaii]